MCRLLADGLDAGWVSPGPAVADDVKAMRCATIKNTECHMLSSWEMRLTSSVLSSTTWFEPNRYEHAVFGFWGDSNQRAVVE